MPRIKPFILVLASVALLSSCGILRPGLVGETDFEAHADRMAASGIGGLWFKTRIAFGSFHTGTFNRHGIDTRGGSAETTGWHLGPGAGAPDEEQRKTNAFSFDQYDSLGQVAHVSAAAFRNARIRHYGKETELEDIDSSGYRITISQAGREQAFAFPDTGAVFFRAGPDWVKAEQVTRWDKASKRVFKGVLFSVAGKTVAAVQRYDSGIVWMARGLPDEERLTLAAAATAVLLKPKLGAEPD